ncbi:DUF2057 family protein [Vibrio cholerae]
MLKRTIVLLLFLSLSISARAYELSLGQGIEVLFVNGSKASESSILNGKYLQLVVRYSGRLKKDGKMEYYASYPYLVTIMAEDNHSITSDVTITLPSNQYDSISRIDQKKQPIFTIHTGQAGLNIDQRILPATAEVFPYKDIGSLVAAYNMQNGIFFNKNLDKVEVVATESSDIVGESLYQLQALYLNASKEERKAFKKWMVDQE